MKLPEPRRAADDNAMHQQRNTKAELERADGHNGFRVPGVSDASMQGLSGSASAFLTLPGSV